MATAEQIDQMRRDREHASRRVRELLTIASTTESGEPILHMITKYRKSASMAVQIFVITVPSLLCVDISAEVALIIGARYSQTHRGVLIGGVGVNIHQHLAERFASALNGFDARDSIHYRSV